MDFKIKLYGILVNDKDEILLKREDYSLPGDDVVIGKELTSSIKKIIQMKTNITLVDILLFDEKSIIEKNVHTLAIFYIGTFYKEEIEKINQIYGWYKLNKLDIEKLDVFSRFIVKQILSK